MPARTEIDRLYEVVVERDVRIPTRDPGVTLSGDLFLPKDVGDVPVLITALPYRRDITALTGSPTERWFAAHGYASLLIDLLGTGSSDGVQRPPFDPAEADDALDAIRWATAQPWCSGSVGMWGGSYGALTTMRTAARRPPELRAIIAIEGLSDPSRDFVHPGGSRGAFSPLGAWALGTLFNQLLPPVDDFADPKEQARWRRRLAAPPYLLDLYRHGPGAVVWSDREVDASAIEVPALCVAGWRDLFVDGMIRAYERMQGNKKLIAGPWMHVMPQECPFTPIDFLGMARSWWDQWLKPESMPVDDTPPVSAYVQGNRPRWLGFGSWPPGATPRTEDLSSWLRTEPVALDPAVGLQSGLWSTPAGQYGLPFDQHDDDSHSLCYTSAPLEEPVLIGGRPEVELVRPWPRVSVKLADVDAAGRSFLICAGLEVASEATERARIPLTPTTYEVAAGHRIRIVVAPGDFPRVWPMFPPEADLPEAETLYLPVATEPGEEIGYSAPEQAGPSDEEDGENGRRAFWEVTQDLLNDKVTLRLGGRNEIRPDDVPGRKLSMVVDQEIAATAHRLAPEDSTVTGRIEGTVSLASGERIIVEAEVNVTPTTLDATGMVECNGARLLDRHWHA
ncbi:CocE/NonD family hydrolase [Amycolatopsis sp. NPDC049868]|uniref:CocE/NonD family hydrolase n=1 Tax=Amycolatopsis sp. NPDC049868 TaxID=3363934 RepID=UPI0037B9B89F